MRELERKRGSGFNAARFHRAFLEMGQVPISVVERNIADRLGNELKW